MASRQTGKSSWIDVAGIFLALAVVAFFVAGEKSVPAEEEGRLEELLPAFEYFRNPWTVVGLKDYPSGTRVSPDGRLILADGRQVIIRIGPKGDPLPRSAFATLMEGWLPIVQFSVEHQGVLYTINFWASPIPEHPEWEKAYDWPIAGDTYSTWIRIEARNPGDQPAEAAVHLAVLSSGLMTCQKEQSLLAPGGLCQWAFRVDYPQPSPAGSPAPEPAEAAVGLATGAPSAPRVASPEEASTWLNRTREAWERILAPATRIELPCAKSTLAYKAALVCQLITSDLGEVHGGEGFYDELYIRDGAYQILHLLEAGLLDAGRHAVQHFLRHQLPEGRFETQKGQLDANGQALWTFWKFYRMTGDESFLREVYPQMVRAAEWIREARRKEPADGPFAGLLPAAVADGEYLWDGKHHIVGYDFWNLRGLICVAQAAEALGRKDDARRWQEEISDYRRAIDRAWERTGLPYFPPSWEKAGTHWGNTETLWPTALFDAHDPRVTALIHHLRREFGGGYHEGIIRWIGHRPAIHPYMGAYTALASLRRGERKDFLSDFFSYLVHSSATHGFPEGIYPESRTAWSNTIPHPTGAANFALMLRHMIVDEEADRLCLLRGVPAEWLAPGKKIRVLGAPTEFGKIDLELAGTEEGIRGTIRASWRDEGPRVLVVVPPRPGWHVAMEGVDQKTVVILPAAPSTGQWRYEEFVAGYQKQAPPRVLPAIPGLEALPIIPPPDPARCRSIDLRAFANTDPFTAPFGVPRPGKYLFTGMPPGQVEILGVPFTIINPADNEGRGLVVLHSSEWPVAATFPVEVVIPVDEVVRRVYLLGNVGGWTAKEIREGQDQAVAEYRFLYADGSEETVPLIPGRTLDDWAAPPAAEDTLAVLRGSPWHLNLLVVRTKSSKLDKIIFRDLGTPTALVLVALTVEK